MATIQTSRIGMFIHGGEAWPTDERTFETTDPFAGTVWAEVADGGIPDVEAAVRSAQNALTGEWGALTPPARGRLMLAFADAIDVHADELAMLETRDTGKLLREMTGQVAALGDWLRYYAGLADKIEGSVLPTDKASFLVYTRRAPVGVVAAITPWNSPLLLLMWKLAPALAAGCPVIVKPSEYTSASTVRLAQIAVGAGLPPGVFNVVTGWGPAVGRALTTHPGIAKVAFTGSTETGRAVAAAAAEGFKRVTLELGGKSAQIVFPDADLEAATNGILAGIFAATGQTCMAGSRLLVHRDIADELVRRLVARAHTITLGDPSSPATQMGPIANERQFHRVLGFIDEAVREGATVACGGRAAGLGGFFVEPTILTDIPAGARILQDEVFGPVLGVVPFDDESEAVERANGTEFGLAGAVWTRDIQRAHRVAGRLRAGSVWINAYRTVAPQVPFGGFGASGMGRENGPHAVDEYLETTAVWVELSGATRDPFVLG